MSAMRRKYKGGSKGFTIIELVAVLILLGIMAALAIARVGDTSTYDLNSQLEAVKNHLRYAQIRAMNTDTAWGIHFTESSYYLFEGLGSETPVVIPGEDATIDMDAKKSKLRFTSLPAGGRVTFDTFGRPVNASEDPETVNIRISTNGSAIVITRNTGFIP
ncbi:MAG: prepilin-type N-terminal cleavage/methylation domain-containing protein [Syntrophales bacterium]|nr:prepilin-type N-terminal cleavage/methylation domain-containing protein [Syntrophales bacterium]MCK9528798.1 prepilin-type N-terminal cleavage/methylation domain-containing protein [Syntrophales bacterium]MDX9922745.1 prepilin-type N-terminal cleavage/methylation domain-containing protein [Syntrophales bacterium]